MSHDELIQQLRGRAEYLRYKGGIKTPELMERAAATIEALEAEQIGIPPCVHPRAALSRNAAGLQCCTICKRYWE